MPARLDLSLKYLCLVKSRSLAKSLCDAGHVLVNGEPARSSARVRPEDRLTVQFRGRTVTVVLIDVPEKQLSKAAAPDYYRGVDTPPSELPPDPLEDL